MTWSQWRSVELRESARSPERAMVRLSGKGCGPEEGPDSRYGVSMCGRVVTASGPEELSEYLGADVVVDVLDGPDYNVAPSRQLPLAWTSDEGGRRFLGTAKWGLVPSWAKDPAIGERMFNARAETVAEKPSFRAAFRHRRCLVVVDGFYEWGPAERLVSTRTTGGRATRQPWYVHRVDGNPLVLAGLWEHGKGLRTCSIITVPANDDLAPVHDRMPAVLESVDWDGWLDDGDPDRLDLESLLAPADDGTLVRHTVHCRVNSARNKGLELIEPADPVAAPDQGALW